MEITDKNFLNIHEARAFLGVSRSFLYKIKNKLPAHGLGNKTYFRKSDLESLFTPKVIARKNKSTQLG